MDLTTRYKKSLPAILGAVTAIPIAGFTMGWPPKGAILFAFGVFVSPLFGYLLNPSEGG